MRQRTENETRAYVEGYTNCYNMFVEYLDRGINRNREAIEKMRLMVTAVQAVITDMEDKENEESGGRK